MEVSSNRTSPSVMQIHVRGEIDLATADQLKRAVCTAIAATGTQDVTVCLADVAFCDSSGLACLDECYDAAVTEGVRFRVADPQPVVRRVLEIVGLLDVLTAP